MLFEPKDLMILKLLNPEGYEGANSYDHVDGWFEFEGFLKVAPTVFDGYTGIEFGDEEYYMVHSTYCAHECFDFRCSDKLEVLTRPWIVFITGCDDVYGMFMRFESYADMCGWLVSPCKQRLYVMY